MIINMPTSNTNPIDDCHVLEIYIHDEDCLLYTSDAADE